MSFNLEIDENYAASQGVTRKKRVLWLSGLPGIVQEKALGGEDHGSHAPWSWIIGHLPPPPQIDLHVGCLWPGGTKRKSVQFEGATFHLIPCPKRGRALLLFQLDRFYFKELWKELRPALVHGWGTEDSNGLVALQLEPKHHVVEIQGLISACHEILPKTYRRSLLRLTERVTLWRARNIVAESQFALTAAADLSRNALMEVIEQPLRREFLTASPSRGTAREVLFVGSILPSKGIMDALKAFASAAPEGWTLHIIGSGTAEDENRMLEFVASSGLGSRFRHSRGSNTQGVIEAMRESSVFLLPTRVDSGPTALKEALTMCLWPVCYDNSGPGEYIRKYNFGSLASDGDASDLGSELTRCFASLPWQDDNLRMNIARRTRKDFSREYAWRRLLAFYELVLRRP